MDLIKILKKNKYLYTCLSRNRFLSFCYSKYKYLTGNNIFKKGKRVSGKIKKDIIGSKNNITVGNNCEFHDFSIHIRGNNNRIIIGDNCYFGPENNLWAEGDSNEIIIGPDSSFTWRNHINAQEGHTKIIIGTDCMVSNNIIIRTSDSHPIYDLNTGERINPAQDVKIGDHVWIAPNSRVMKGAEIPEGCIVASDSTVNKSFRSSNCLLGGRPAKVLKENIKWTRNPI
ncbi:MAG: acyltransferase [Muribaculaceae bacterium]|nr:acyltransferase [Muribaculaceae bacterium]